MEKHTLTRHKDIQTWVAKRGGLPAIARVRTPLGGLESRLQLRFQEQKRKVTRAPSLDDGASPCSWAAWLAELDRQRLALSVADSDRPDYELVPLAEIKRTSLN